jgi:tRNA(Ile)-lysidine synthase
MPLSANALARDDVPDAPITPSAILRASLEVALARADGPLVLAVSGGRDSMALLQALVTWAPDRIAAVATFDHGTGGYATDAAALVAAEGRRMGLTVVREKARTTGRSEADWRAARWAFLRRVARAYRAQVATAHTRDDQVETVVMRLLRGAGARGLAGLAAPSSIVRPWLGVSRHEVAAWAAHASVPFLDDPTNATPTFLRGRVRHDLLPLLEAAHPGFGNAMIGIGERAATWRREVDAFVESLGITRVGATVVRVPVRALEATTTDGRAVLWAALFAMVGVALDARGTQALIRFTDGGRRGAHITLAGGAVALRQGDGVIDCFELRGGAATAVTAPAPWEGTGATLPSRWGRWRFRRVGSGPSGPSGALAARPDADWWCAIPAVGALHLRTWQPGDRIQVAGAEAGRRVARYFAEAAVPALDRPTWPVVLAGDEIMWIPGVCRSVAAPYRPGRPDSIWYRCERQYD